METIKLAEIEPPVFRIEFPDRTVKEYDPYVLQDEIRRGLRKLKDGEDYNADGAEVIRKCLEVPAGVNVTAAQCIEIKTRVFAMADDLLTGKKNSPPTPK